MTSEGTDVFSPSNSPILDSYISDIAVDPNGMVWLGYFIANGVSRFDPATGTFPEDPLLGLLYPEDGTGRGVGSVSYTVTPKAGLSSGTVINNRARIVFDYNDPIDTPQVHNALDAAPPTSQVLSGCP